MIFGHSRRAWTSESGWRTQHARQRALLMILILLALVINGLATRSLLATTVRPRQHALQRESSKVHHRSPSQKAAIIESRAGRTEVAFRIPNDQTANFQSQQDEQRGLELYTKKIKPLLTDKCYKCHSYKHDRFENGLSVEKREDLINGGDRGAAIEPGEPDESLLIDALNYERDDLQMPPDGKLDDKEIEAIKEWIRLGAPFPKNTP